MSVVALAMTMLRATLRRPLPWALMLAGFLLLLVSARLDMLSLEPDHGRSKLLVLGTLDMVGAVVSILLAVSGTAEDQRGDLRPMIAASSASPVGGMLARLACVTAATAIVSLLLALVAGLQLHIAYDTCIIHISSSIPSVVSLAAWASVATLVAGAPVALLATGALYLGARALDSPAVLAALGQRAEFSGGPPAWGAAALSVTAPLAIAALLYRRAAARA